MSMDNDEERELALLLADPSLWLEPGPDVEAGVIEAIRAQRAASALVDGSAADSAGAAVVPMRARRKAWTTQFAAGLVGAAAAALIAVVVVRSSDEDTPLSSAPDSSFQLVGTDLAPGFDGSAEVQVQPSGTLIRMVVVGLPRREGGDFYEAWLKSCDGTELVPIGTFHDMDRATGWAGVPVQDFPVLTVTQEQVAGPQDIQQGSSGLVVVTGQISPCPAT
jgi:Anti-sigma-K factor rskA